MKKLVLVLSSLAAAVAVLYFSPTLLSPTAQAQSSRERSVSPGSDRKMAAEIKRLTNRSRSRLSRNKLEAALDLDGGFQNVALARMGDDEHVEGYCATSIGEANAFFGRDLDTGEAVPRLKLPKYDVTKSAADHGMSMEEFVLYSQMAAQFAELQASSPQSSAINIVNNDGVGEGFNDVTPAFVIGEGGNNGLTRGDQRLNVFNAAAAIWGNFLDSSVPIQVRSQMDPQTCSTSGAVLGSAGATTIHSGFANAPFPNTWYNQALANKLSGADRSAAQPDINATFNISIDNGCLQAGSRWYYGLDNATPPGRINLLVVLLHEMGHGLGFQTFASGSTGALNQGIPDQWSRMMYDTTTGLHWDVMTDVQRQASALSSGGLVWDGPNAMNASNYLTTGSDASRRIRLYTPATFSPGSSVSHFDTVCSPNVLMEPNINNGLPINLDLTRQLMRDIGWYRDTTSDLIPDTITNVQPAAGIANIGSTTDITWTNNGGFGRNVTIELSTDGGSTYPVTIASNILNTGSFQWTVPNTPSSAGRIRVREANFVDPLGASSGNFSIALVASVSISGRVLSATGEAVRRATVTITGPGVARTVPVSGRGAYLFTGLNPGVTYSVTATSGRFAFETRTVVPQADLASFDIRAL